MRFVRLCLLYFKKLGAFLKFILDGSTRAFGNGNVRYVRVIATLFLLRNIAAIACPFDGRVLGFNKPFSGVMLRLDILFALRAFVVIFRRRCKFTEKYLRGKNFGLF